MTGEWLYGVGEWLLFAAAAGLLYGGAEVGYRYGRRYTHRTGDNIREHVGTVEGALLGLLALLLGFAFAMAMSRFDARKQAVLEEVNDLQTAYLRAHLLAVPRADVCRGLLREHLAARIAHCRAGTDADLLRQAEEETDRLQVQLWAEAVAATRGDPNEVTTGYYVEALNRLLDDRSKRAAAMANHVPETILLLLLLVAALTLAVTGYSSDLRGRRLKALRAILVLLVTATLVVIVDLDRPRRGLIRVSEDGMLRLQTNLDRFAPLP